MSERLAIRAEILKLARLLGIDEEELDYLLIVPPEDLRRLREQATDRLFASGSAALGGVATAARILPAAISATIAERAFGPLLCARVAAAVDTGRAVDVASRLSPGFLADTAVELDPRRAAAIIAAVPVELVVAVARELGSRGEHVTMGRFLAFLPDAGIRDAMAALDDEAVLRTAFVLEDKQRLDAAIAMLPPGRLERLLRRATDLGLWPETLDLLDHLSDERRAAIARFIDGEDPETIEAIVRAAAAEALWVELVPLIEVLPPAARRRLPPIAAGLEPELLAAVIRAAARRPEALPPLLEIAAEMDPPERAGLVAAVDAVERQVAEDLAAAFADPAVFAPLLAMLTDDIRLAIGRAAERHGLEDVLARALGG